MQRELKVTVGSAVALSIVLFLAAPRVQPAAPPARMHRQVRLAAAVATVPIAITKVTRGHATVQPGQFVRSGRSPREEPRLFLAGDDWVQNLTLYLLNRTGRTIVYATIGFVFAESKPVTGFSVVLGRMPDAVGPMRQGAPGTSPILFRPGQTLAVHLSDYTAKIQAEVDSVFPVAALTKVEVTPHRCFFEDGLQFNGGYLILDPQTSTWRRQNPNF